MVSVDMPEDLSYAQDAVDLFNKNVEEG